MSTISASTTSTTAYKVTADTTGTLVLQTGSTPTTAMTIDSSGNVGIGASSTNRISITYDGGTGAATIGPNSTGGSTYLILGTSNSGTYAERVRIDSSGNVGIGINSPVYKVDAVTSALGTTAGNQQYIYRGTTNTGNTDQFDVLYDRTSSASGWTSADLVIRRNVDSTGGQSQIRFGSANFTSFWTNSAERARIDSSGNFIVGATSLQAAARISLAYNGGAYNALGLNDTNNTTGAGYIYMQANGSTIGSIVRVGSGSTVAYQTSSDYRLKEDIQPMVGALAKVAQIKPVTYKWKSDGSDGQGFIAHELQEVVPDCVTGEKDAVDENGNPVYQGIDTSFLVATLTAAIQELKAELDAAKADIATLKGAA